MTDWLDELLSKTGQPERPCDACAELTPRPELREVAMVAMVTEAVPGCEISPQRIYWCCPRCTAAYGEYRPAVR